MQVRMWPSEDIPIYSDTGITTSEMLIHLASMFDPTAEPHPHNMLYLTDGTREGERHNAHLMPQTLRVQGSLCVCVLSPV